MEPKKKPLKKKRLLGNKPVVKKKLLTRFRTRVRSRHPTHDPLRTQLPLLPFRSIVRLGSTTIKAVDSIKKFIECNTVQAIKNSANKLLMKQCFDRDTVRSATWIHTSLCSKQEFDAWFTDDRFPLVSKSLNGSRGRGNRLHKTRDELNTFLTNHTGNLVNYIFEKFHDYSREYRLHVTKEGCFYTCRKMLKSDTPEDKRWFRNDSNSSWIMEENPAFDKPVNWNAIITECVKALVAVGLDVGACDVKVQSAKDKKGNARKEPEFIVIEINSAPSFGTVTLAKYLTIIPEILQGKRNAQ